MFAVTWNVTMGSCVESLVFTGDTILRSYRNFGRCGLVGGNRSEGVWLWSLNLASDPFLPLWLLPTISLSLKLCCRVFIVSWYKRYHNTADLISETSLSCTGIPSCYSTIVFSSEILFPWVPRHAYVTTFWLPKENGPSWSFHYSLIIPALSCLRLAFHLTPKLSQSLVSPSTNKILPTKHISISCPPFLLVACSRPFNS